MFTLNENRDLAMVTSHQIMHAYWSSHARQVMLWLESHPDNAAGKYDAAIYQARAANSYKMIELLRGW